MSVNKRRNDVLKNYCFVKDYFKSVKSKIIRVGIIIKVVKIYINLNINYLHNR